jgi:peroxiredoxin
MAGVMESRTKTKPRWLLIVLEIVLAAAILYSVYWWRTRDLLPTGQAIDVPRFELQTLDGPVWSQAELAGNANVIYFFAPWCHVCNASAHQLRWFDSWFGNSVKLVLVAMEWDTLDDLRAYRDRHDLKAPILLGDAVMARKFRVPGYPLYYIVDANGRIRGRDFGYTTVPGLLARTIAL